MTLRKITISGFKSIEHAEVELRALNVLIGANGAGKSNFVGVFELLREVVDGRLESYALRKGGADKLLRFGQKHTPRLGFDFDFEPFGYSLRLAPAEGESLYVEEEAYLHRDPGGAGLVPVHRNEGRRQSLLRGQVEGSRPLSEQARAVSSAILDAIGGWRLYHFHDTSTSAKVKQLGDIGDVHALRSDASNLAAFLYLLQRTARSSFDFITAMVRRVAPFFERFELRPFPANEELIRLEWVERGSDAYFNAHALSDGTLRFICLATLLLQPELPSVILIDEPELGLHPMAITLLSEFLQHAAHRTRVVVSTQSVTLVDHLEPSDLIVVEREPLTGASTFHRPTPEEIQAWLDDYSLGELWQKNVLGGRPQ